VLDDAGVDLGEQPQQRFGRAAQDLREREKTEIVVHRRERKEGECGCGLLGCWVGLVTGYWTAGGLAMGFVIFQMFFFSFSFLYYCPEFYDPY
jgi:hypothetical protein